MASSGELRIEVEQDAGPSGSLTVVRATGEVDLTNAEDLERALGAADGGARARPHRGRLHGLERAAGAARQGRSSPSRSFALVLRHGSPVLRLIELSEVENRLPWFESEADAVEAVDRVGGRSGWLTHAHRGRRSAMASSSPSRATSTSRRSSPRPKTRS